MVGSDTQLDVHDRLFRETRPGVLAERSGYVRLNLRGWRDIGNPSRILRLSDDEAMGHGSHNPWVPVSSPGGPTLYNNEL